MMKRLILAALLSAGCATPLFSPNAGCEEIVPADPAFSGWKVMECAHPFPSHQAALNGISCSTRADHIGPQPSPSAVLPCGWTAGVTDRANKTVRFYWYYPEALNHERLHVLGVIGDGQ